MLRKIIKSVFVLLQVFLGLCVHLAKALKNKNGLPKKKIAYDFKILP